MSLRIRDDIVHLESTIGSNMAQTVAGGTLTIPSSMPAADRIVKMSATAHVKEHWLEEDRVNIEGMLSVNLIYAGQYDTGQTYYGGVQSAEVVAFSHFVDIPGAMPGMTPHSTATVLDLQPTLRSDGRTVDVDSVLEVSSTVLRAQELAFLTDASVSPPRKIKVSKDTFHFDDVVGQGPAQTEIRHVLPVSLGSERPLRILELVGSFKVAEKRAAVDRGVLSGTMSYKAVCVVLSEHTDDEQLRVYSWDDVARMELSAEIPSARPGMTIHAEVAPPTVFGRVINEGQSIGVEGVQSAIIKVVEQGDIPVVTGLEADSNLKIGLRTESIMYEKVGDGATKDVHIDGSVDLPDSRPPLEKLLDVEVRAAVASTSLVGGRVTVTGYLDLAAMYVARTDDFTQPVYHAVWNNAGTFETSINMPTVSADGKLEADVIVLNVQGEPLSRETIGFQGTLKVICRARERVAKEVVAEAVELRQFPGRLPTYTCVTLQAEDTLWQLATKYGVTTEVLLEQNPALADLDDYDVLPAGSKIIISKQGASSLV
ncbi:MAG: DUF3794 domain-containing protein [Firmicutes bacterium]|nr:DUF3794 domain-containing protein [Bacillota bacterium]